jgi:uncharacterized protein YndB with AHSA1/START domain
MTPELLLTRSYAAPRRLLFEVWTQPEHLARWWGPAGFTLPTCEVDLRVGGAFRFVMRGPDGQLYPFEGTFDQIVAPERLVFTGRIHGDPEHVVRTEVRFVERDGRTKVTVHQRYTREDDAVRGAPIGWSQSLDRLGELVLHLQ